jgi:hypothetical protein
MPSQSFNFTDHYKDDVLSQNKSIFGDYADRIYPTFILGGKYPIVSLAEKA